MIYKEKFRKDLGETRWQILGEVAGKRVTRKAIFKTKQEAKNFVLDLQIQAARDKEGFAPDAGFSAPVKKLEITLGALENYAKGHQDYIRRPDYLKQFADFCDKVRGGRERVLTTLTKKDLKDYEERLPAGLKNSSINRYMAMVQSILTMAITAFEALDSWRPPQRKTKKNPPPRTRVLTAEEIEAILNACLAPRQPKETAQGVANRRKVYDVLRMMLLTGARSGEVRKMTPDQISRAHKAIEITSHKGGLDVENKRRIPLSDTALEILDSRLSDEKLFGIAKHTLKRTLKLIGQISGVPYGQKLTWGWTAHDWRRTAASFLENNARLPYSAVSAIIGHSRGDVTSIYTPAQDPTCVEGMRKLEQMLLTAQEGGPQAPGRAQVILATLEEMISSGGPQAEALLNRLENLLLYAGAREMPVNIGPQGAGDILVTPQLDTVIYSAIQ